jgi:ferredoxin
LRSRGFKVLAAASFSAEHSVSSQVYQIAKGRPDKADMETIEQFGTQIQKKLTSDPSEIQISDRLKNVSTNELVDSFPEGYHKQRLEILKTLMHVEFENYALCSNCMSCENACPTNALKIRSKEIDSNLCIWCTACARACPEGVFSFHWINESPAYFERLDKVFGSRKEPKIFI